MISIFSWTDLTVEERIMSILTRTGPCLAGFQLGVILNISPGEFTLRSFDWKLKV